MNNPFLELNNRKKYFFTKDNQNYFLRFISTKETFNQCPQLTDMINQVVVDAQISLNDDLKKEGRYIEVSKKENVFQVKQEWIDGFFASKGFCGVVEDEKGKLIASAVCSFDNPTAKQAMKISPEIGTFVGIPLTIVDNEWRNTGIAGALFCKLMSMLENPKRDIKKPVAYGTAVRLEFDNLDSPHLINASRYHYMWSARLNNNYMQPRYLGKEDIGEQKIAFEKLFPDGTYDREKMSKVINNEIVNNSVKKKIHPDKQFQGYFIVGEQKLDYPSCKAIKELTLQKLVEKQRAKL